MVEFTKIIVLNIAIFFIWAYIDISAKVTENHPLIRKATGLWVIAIILSCIVFTIGVVSRLFIR